ncbi:hypothetical protein GCM10007301_50050 [Azorhizobium oxalatiphilum]|uniref:TonB C-terminal domain-containing protein n=1 Tax=Azorhizobium oxalatiphilum TaxID=980631 RepID=A0A917CCI7_9HYPH|nr:energy transducer TonB [Azorhizobium oxalatiphilum]GGF84075.1 hypothetical protein GCM10007301_50050 [Azorhizobium oxalatiphilum]
MSRRPKSRIAALSLAATLLFSFAAEAQAPARKPVAPPATKQEWMNVANQQLMRRRRMPKAAEDQPGRHTVLLEMKVLKDGTITSAAVRESSGVYVLDTAAMAMAKAASPLPPLPPEMGDEHTVTVPVIYEVLAKAEAKAGAEPAKTAEAGASPPSAAPASPAAGTRAIRDATTGFAADLPAPLTSAGVVTQNPTSVKFGVVSETGAPAPAPSERRLCTIGLAVPDPKSPMTRMTQDQLNSDQSLEAGATRMKQQAASSGRAVEQVQALAFANGSVRGIELLIKPPAGPRQDSTREYLAVAYTPHGMMSVNCMLTRDNYEQGLELFRAMARSARIEKAG